MRYLIFGGAGFLGSVLTRMLESEGNKVTVYDKFLHSNETVLGPFTKIVEDDVCNVNKHPEIFKKVDYIFYLAQPRLKDMSSEDEIITEVENLKLVLQKSVEHNIKLLFTSSCSVYGVTNEIVNEDSPVQVTSIYSNLKIQSEQAIQKFKSPLHKIVRLSTLFGIGPVERRDLMINNFMLDMKETGNLELFDANASRPHLFVEDAALILRVLSDTEYEDKVLNIGSRKLVFTKFELATKLSKILELPVVIHKNDTKDSRDYKVDFTRFDELTNFNFVTFNNAIKRSKVMFNRMVCSVEPYHNLIQYYMPNTASPTWYAYEERRFGLPKQWGYWNIMDEDGNLFGKDVIKSLITPPNIPPQLITYKAPDEMNGEKHLYVIHIFCPDYFRDNQGIGLQCVSEQYKQDLREGKAALVFILTLEGYSGEEGNQDLEIIQHWINTENIPGENVHYITGNMIGDQLQKIRGYTYNIRPLCLFDSWLPLHDLPKNRVAKFKPVDDKYLYLSYARNPRYQRVLLASELMQADLLEKGKVSLGRWSHPHQYDQLIPLEISNKLYEKTPIEIDRTLFYNLATDLTLPDYDSTFVSVINETLTSNGTLFLSEKIFKPIAVKHPFFVIGNIGTLRYLKSLGYKTFDKWFDESYDLEPDLIKRVKMIVDQLKGFESRPLHELQTVREEMEEVLNHNHNLFINTLKEKYGLNSQRYYEDSYRPLYSELIDIWNTL